MDFYTQEPLEYGYDALEPFIDARTMELHYTKHHAGYLKKFNLALSKWDGFKVVPIEELLSNVNSFPNELRQTIINNGGGYYNHSLFWKMMTPDTTKRSLGDGSKLKMLIDRDYGSFDNFKNIFTDKALSLFGSGWVWLVHTTDGTLDIRLNSFQNNPLMKDPSVKILLGLDVWEHAYYLKYQNRRAEYIENWWNVVNWEFVDSRLVK